MLESASELCRMPATALASRLRGREVSAVEIVGAFLDRIEATNRSRNAIVSQRPRDEVMAEAARADALLASGESTGALLGLPIAVKDLAQTRGLRTTFGSPIFADFVPAQDDIFVERLKQAGAIIVGKTNVPEFGLGSHTYNQVFGPTHNAFNPNLSAGGSSGGAAVALALDMLPLADGSDMCGSLRNPAAFNNIFGMRPSQGRVPAGPSPESFLSQMGVEGPMARTVADLALLLSVQAGFDPRAPLSLDGRPDFLDGLDRLDPHPRIAWLGDLGGHLATEPGILDLCATALTLLEAEGARVEPIVPNVDFEALWRAFVTLRHATSGCALMIHYDVSSRRDLLKPEAVWEIEGALDLTAEKIFAASTLRTSWYQTVLQLFENHDFLALPTAQVFPFCIDLHWPRSIAGRTMDTYHRWMEVTALATLCGCPAASVPAGFDPRGRPMGIQFIGRPRDDLSVLRLAHRCEAIFPWVGLRPGEVVTSGPAGG